MKLKLIALGLSVILSGCSSQLVSSKSSSDFKMAISSASSIECTDTVITSSVSCIYPLEITSTADSPKSLSGNFYAVVDGKIFLADTTYGGIDSISETWNPAESKSGVVPFTVPPNSNISSIFLGPEGSSSVDDAFLYLAVSVTAVNGWTPEIQSRLSAISKLNELMSRLRESSGYPWENQEFSPEIDVKIVANINGNPFLNKSLKDGKVLPMCFGLIYVDAQNDDFTASYVRDNNVAIYEDSKSGLGIMLDLGAKNSEYCRTVIISASGIKEVK